MRARNMRVARSAVAVLLAGLLCLLPQGSPLAQLALGGGIGLARTVLDKNARLVVLLSALCSGASTCSCMFDIIR